MQAIKPPDKDQRKLVKLFSKSAPVGKKMILLIAQAMSDVHKLENAQAPTDRSA